MHHNVPEALAQTQKGIEQLLAVRDGYRAGRPPLDPPPLDTRTARAMEIVARAPVGIDATPEAMARIESDLQALGYRNTPDALEKLNSQAELLKWSRSRPLVPPEPSPAPPPGAPPAPPSAPHPDALGPAQLARLAKEETSRE